MIHKDCIPKGSFETKLLKIVDMCTKIETNVFSFFCASFTVDTKIGTFTFKLILKESILTIFYQRKKLN